MLHERPSVPGMPSLARLLLANVLQIAFDAPTFVGNNFYARLSEMQRLLSLSEGWHKVRQTSVRMAGQRGLFWLCFTLVMRAAMSWPFRESLPAMCILWSSLFPLNFLSGLDHRPNSDSANSSTFHQTIKLETETSNTICGQPPLRSTKYLPCYDGRKNSKFEKTQWTVKTKPSITTAVRSIALMKALVHQKDSLKHWYCAQSSRSASQSIRML